MAAQIPAEEQPGSGGGGGTVGLLPVRKEEGTLELPQCRATADCGVFRGDKSEDAHGGIRR